MWGIVEDCAEVGGCTPFESRGLDVESPDELATGRKTLDVLDEEGASESLGLGGSTYPYEFVEKGAGEGIPLAIDRREIELGGHRGTVGCEKIGRRLEEGELLGGIERIMEVEAGVLDDEAPDLRRNVGQV